MDKKQQFSVWYVLAAFLALMTFQRMFLGPHTETLAYSDFKALLAAGNVTEASVSEQFVTGKFKSEGIESILPADKAAEAEKFGPGEHPFAARRVEDPGLVEALDAAGVRYSGRTESNWFSTVLSWILPALVFFALWSFLIRRMGAAGGMMEIGKSKVKVYVEQDTKVGFEHVAGVDEAKAELQEVVDFLKNPGGYGRLGARMPKGVLLVGPPGTGKTLLARAVAGEAGVPFFSINGSEFVEMFVGVGAARVRDLFEQARKRAPAIIFIDELDALGRARGIGPMAGGHDEKEQTLNQLLVEMDGFDPSQGLVLLAATNRPEILDPALLRAGRFDRQVLVDRPDRAGRIQILGVHLHKVRLARDVDPEQIAALTPGFSGADLENLVNEAALLATRRGAQDVALEDFTAAVERIVAGLEKRNRVLNPEERRVVAYHEMGHALVAMSTPGSDPVHKISIIPRGIGALGYTIQRPTEDRYLMTRAELENKMAVLMGGRASEHLVFGNLSTGAADDLAKASAIARAMVTRYGMDEKLGHAAYETQQPSLLGMVPSGLQGREFSEGTAREIDCAVRDLVGNAFDRAVKLLESHRDVLEVGATALLEHETLDEPGLARLRERVSVLVRQ